MLKFEPHSLSPSVGPGSIEIFTIHSSFDVNICVYGAVGFFKKNIFIRYTRTPNFHLLWNDF